jgi:hypothetical protein
MLITDKRHLRFNRHSLLPNVYYDLNTQLTNWIVDINKWQHVAVTWDQLLGVVKLYIDANEVGAKPFDTSMTWYAPRDTYEIGYLGVNQFLGSVMDLYIIEGVLNSEQLKYLRGK